MSVHDQIESVRAMAEAVKQISSVEVPSLDIPLEDDGVLGDSLHSKVTIKDSNLDEIDLDGVDDWWNSWCKVRDIMNDFSEANVEDSSSATLGPREMFDTMTLDDDWISLRVDIFSGGERHIIAEYWTPEFSDMLYDGHNNPSPPDEVELVTPESIDEIELGRSVAEAEQKIIMDATGSAAETIDYWHTEVNPDGRGFQTMLQSRWADVRGVGRQTVNDRVRSASGKIGE